MTVTPEVVVPDVVELTLPLNVVVDTDTVEVHGNLERTYKVTFILSL